MSPEAKQELQDLANALLAKCGRLMSPPFIEVCERVADPESWSCDEMGWSLFFDEDAGEIEDIKILYFTQLIAA